MMLFLQNGVKPESLRLFLLQYGKVEDESKSFITLYTALYKKSEALKLGRNEKDITKDEAWEIVSEMSKSILVNVKERFKQWLSGPTKLEELKSNPRAYLPVLARRNVDSDFIKKSLQERMLRGDTNNIISDEDVENIVKLYGETAYQRISAEDGQYY